MKSIIFPVKPKKTHFKPKKTHFKPKKTHFKPKKPLSNPKFFPLIMSVVKEKNRGGSS